MGILSLRGLLALCSQAGGGQCSITYWQDLRTEVKTGLSHETWEVEVLVMVSGEEQDASLSTVPYHGGSSSIVLSDYLSRMVKTMSLSE